MSFACPDYDRMEQFVAGELPSPESEALSRHASDCETCAARLSEVRENLSAVGPLQRLLRRRVENVEGSAMPAPTQAGPYRIIEEIGRGGMGIVYRAEQANPRRFVAVKLLHPGSGSEGRFERMFHREAHVLARMAHPDIAVVHDAGKTLEGRSFLAMELVAGRPLGEFAAGSGWSAEAKLSLFLRVCRAVAYAHQRGVIHRDLKPSNILVNDAGDPKVLDFGLAKILDPDEGDAQLTLLGEEGRIQGTLPYMSPEQVEGRVEEIDVRSDVYSLGVILFELLTGKLPYPINRRRLTEAARTICETPPERLTGVIGALRGEAESIIHKAMEKSPDRRYSSASALADDIQRLLSGQPILARPASARYQLQKWIRRHKGASIVAALALLVLVGGSLFISLLYADARANLARAMTAERLASSEASRARHEADVANEIKDFLVGVFRVSDPGLGAGSRVTARELLDRAAAGVDRNVSADPRLRAELTCVIGDVYVSMGLYEQGATFLRRAYDAWKTLDPDSFQMASTASSMATADRLLGRLDQAAAEYSVALEIMRHNRKGDDFHVVSILRSLAEVQAERGEDGEAERMMRDLVSVMRRDPNQRYALAGALSGLAGMLSDREAYADALPLMDEALDAARELNSIYRDALLNKLEGNWAWLLANAGRLDEAEATAGRVLAERRARLPENHPELATPLVTLGMVQLRRGAPARAEPFLREALSIRESRLEPNHPAIAEIRGLIGQALLEEDRLDEAESMLRAAQETFLVDPRRNAIPLAHVATRLAACCRKSGRLVEAEQWDQAARVGSVGGDSKGE